MLRFLWYFSNPLIFFSIGKEGPGSSRPGHSARLSPSHLSYPKGFPGPGAGDRGAAPLRSTSAPTHPLRRAGREREGLPRVAADLQLPALCVGITNRSQAAARGPFRGFCPHPTTPQPVTPGDIGAVLLQQPWRWGHGQGRAAPGKGLGGNGASPGTLPTSSSPDPKGTLQSPWLQPHRGHHVAGAHGEDSQSSIPGLGP